MTIFDLFSLLGGLALFLFGMQVLGDALSKVSGGRMEKILEKMTSNPIKGVLLGALVTGVIQSSSASVGILQALCVTGTIPFSVVFPIIMGQNIGTCVTALLSGIGASKNARRAALIHLYFNVIGTIIFLILFYTLNAFIQFSFFHDAATPMGIAIVHSVFNVTATVILLPFGKLLEKLACFTIKDDPKKEEVEKVDRFSILDERFLETPGLAMEQCQNAALDMANLAKDAFLAAHALFSSYSDEKLNAVKEQEDLLDRYEDELGSYLVKLSSKNMSVKDSHMLTVLLHCIGDLERIGDHAVNVAHSAKEMNEKNLRFSDAAEEELKVYAQAIKDILVTAVSALETQDIKVAQSVEPLEEVIDDLSDELMSRHVRRLRKGECTIEMGFILADIMNNYERVSDHCSNIAICAIQESEDVEAHQYMEKMRSSENHDFVSAVEVYKKKYLLP